MEIPEGERTDLKVTSQFLERFVIVERAIHKSV
jgi:hypothetical protein